MDDLELYDAAARARLVPEPPKRVAAPERTAFERDRARVVHARRRGGWRPRPRWSGRGATTSSATGSPTRLEVAQVARDLARPLGCDPDVVETAALAHDLGHPPFGHNGERALDELCGACGGFEGNAQTLRHADPARGQDVRRRRAAASGSTSPGPPSTPPRSTPGPAAAAEDAARGARRRDAPGGRASSASTTTTCRSSPGCGTGVEGRGAVPRGAGDGPRRRRRLLRPRRRGRHRRRPHRPRRARSTGSAPRSGRRSATGTSPASTTTTLDAVLDGLAAVERLAARRRTTGAGAALAALKNLTSDADRAVLRQRPARRRTRRSATARSSRYAADLVVPRGRPGWRSRCSRASRRTRDAGRRPGHRAGPAARGGRRAGRGARRARGRTRSSRPFADDFAAAADDAARLRVVVDQVASPDRCSSGRRR